MVAVTVGYTRGKKGLDLAGLLEYTYQLFALGRSPGHSCQLTKLKKDCSRLPSRSSRHGHSSGAPFSSASPISISPLDEAGIRGFCAPQPYTSKLTMDVMQGSNISISQVVRGAACFVTHAAIFRYAVSLGSPFIHTVGGWPWSLTIATGEGTTFPLNIGCDCALIRGRRAACAAILPAIVGSPCSQLRGGWRGSLTVALVRVHQYYGVNRALSE